MFATHPIGLPVPRTPSERLAATIDALCREVAAYAVRDRAFQVFILLLYGRLQRVKSRFAVLAGKFDSGTLRASLRRPRPAAATTASANPAAPAVRPLPMLALPRRFGWVAYWVAGTAGYGSQLRALLDDPEMQALLRAAPQAARLLRPLAHMLAVRPLPEALRLPPRPARPPRPPKPPKLPGPPKLSRRPRSRPPRQAHTGQVALDLSREDAWDRLLAQCPPSDPPTAFVSPHRHRKPA